ncbi:Down syndrome cell adhesion molecule-like protein Dscam2 isoform X3 [Harmonia axyridis]|uniref:Down syndrome cell adhesion molecule-like protein Dscam2 isoform X3 n=1 Tax=Harmonia axyridis TaxID=115357 RepID=UPI001E277233|nr:Down syndrome cell adhesion molecule-like protein Dscam2 isoform X3 [Harmonia axyridis]
MSVCGEFRLQIMPLVCFGIAIAFLTGHSSSFDLHLRGPSFVMEPPPQLEFSNSSGGWLDCSASGSPQPSIDWLSVDGTSVGDVSGIRRVLRNGTLFLQPFSAASYRQDIHSTVYRCVASNTVGRIISRDVQVRAVVTQAYKVDVEVRGAARGCTAVLKCVIPAFVKDLVRIISWVQEPSLFIYPSLQGDGKFHQLPSGELLVHNLEFSDQFPTYRCRTMHKLSRQVIVSAHANIRITEHRGIVPPVIAENSDSITVSQDEGAALICIAQGCPSPEYRWYSHSGTETSLVTPGPRMRQLGPVLAIEAVTLDDAGVYRCSAANAGGEASAELRLIVSTPLHVEITPPLLSVHMGGSAEFRCVISTQSGGPHLVTWYKDGRQLPSTGRGSSETLMINNVGREDRGMYQCVIRRAEGDTAQAAAELQLGDAPPMLIYSFIEQTLQPGPAVSLKCSASGNPTPEISWSLDGFQLPSHGRFVIGQYVTVHGDVISHVNISHVMVEDGGEYTCTAKNRAGTSSHSARLNVYGMPYIRLIPKVTAVSGEVLQLKCPVAGYPIEEIHWERAGRELPDDLRQKVMPDGTLVINPVEKKADSGVYTCWARNKQGHSARRSGEVAVIVPPKVSPFYTEETLHVGDRASLTCSVTKGDLPLTISWHKDGNMVQPSHSMSVTQVDQFTSILVIESLTPDHNGNYTCIVRNAAAEVSHMQQLLVNVPPIIEPFSFQDGLSEGMRTRTVCGVSSGDPPLVVSWLKDGQPLTPSLGVNVSALDPYSSLLSISSLGSRHSGDFTCVASNPAAEVRYTAKLQVKVPPRWLVEPVDVSVERKRNVALHCQAQGVPTPTVTWKKAASKSGNYEEVRDHTFTKLLGNGTLLLQHVKEDREGYYLCQAENGIGSGIGKVIQLRVNSSPYFAVPSRQVTVKKGDKAVLHCDVNGDKPISVAWLRGGTKELNPVTNYRLNIKQDVTPDGVSAELQILNSDATDNGAYFCQATNMFGKDQQLVQLLVQEPPMSPQNVEATMIGSRSVNLKWQHRSGDSTEVFKFIIEYRQQDKTWQYIEVTDVPLSYAFLIEDLKPATKYIFRVIAEGPAGRSNPSAELSVKTEPQRPGGPPLNVAVRPVSSTEMLITWSPPVPELRHGDIQGFNIGYRTSSMGSYNFTSVPGDGEDGGELLLSNLEKFTRYTIVVQAFNEVGMGPTSEAITEQTMEDVPSMPPDDVRCAALTSQSVQVSWQPPPTIHCNGLLQGYKLIYEPVLDDNLRGNDEMETRKTTALTTVITGLSKFTNYSLQVLAYTKVGDGVLTAPTYCQTGEDVPGPPFDIKVVVSSPQSLRVSWLPPIEPNGMLTKYNLYKRSMDGGNEIDHNKQTISTQQTDYEVKNIQPLIEYQFWVTASTRIGEGPNSKTVSQVITSRVPARIVSFGGLVVKPWRSSVTIPCESVGSPRREWIHGEQVLKGGANHNQQLLDTGELIISNLQKSDTGNYSCQVDNGQGSDRITYYLLVQVTPSAPILYVASATSSSILLHWKPGSNGGAPISGFTLSFKKEHENLEEVALSRHATSYELKGLSCGTTYHLYLTATNKIGTSPASDPLQARTQGSPPGVPPSSSFVFPNSTSVILRLHIWPDNGCPISYFVLQYRKSVDSQWTLVSNALKPQRKTSITGLSSATQYIVKVEAHNVAGYSFEEFTFITLTKDGEIPSQHLMKNKHNNDSFYTDIKIILPAAGAGILLVLMSVTILSYLKRRRNEAAKERLENLQNAEAQRERYYATIHKVGLQAGEKIPETSEDISPYATFQLSEPSTLPVTTAMLHSFMYHEHPMTEGCASTPPATSSIQRNSPYYNMQKLQGTKGHGRRKAGRKNDVDSEESESDGDQLTSSRTESSNQLDMKIKHSYLYHGAQSSTSSDISPMCEQKSLPRRNRSRWLSQGRSPTQRQMLALTVAETTFLERPDQSEQNTPDRPSAELSEAECDIDTLKKIKLGLRSSLWSRPASSSGQPTDYSIAV